MVLREAYAGDVSDSSRGQVIGHLRYRLARTDVEPGPAGSILAGVLVPLVESPAGWSIVFTRRAETLSSHSGEISFPGGSVDPGEEGRDAALREAHEELGIVPENVEVLGMLPRVFTVASNFMIEPWVGMIERSEFVPNPAEIAEVIEVPIDVLITPGTRRDQRFIRAGAVYLNPAYDVGSHTIWGATARILNDLLERLNPESGC